MKIIRLESIYSTQEYLKNLLESQSQNQDILVTTDRQISGIGRLGKTWDFLPGSIACSFTLKPHPNLPLSSLEIAILTHQFIKKELGISMEFKWPNDLFFNKKKCGGIILHTFKNILIIGLGLNAYSKSLDNSDTRSGLPITRNFSKELYKYCLGHRISNNFAVQNYWEEHCFHLNKMVEINQEKGVFKNLGPNGEACIEVDGKISSHHSGSLRFLF